MHFAYCRDEFVFAILKKEDARFEDEGGCTRRMAGGVFAAQCIGQKCIQKALESTNLREFYLNISSLRSSMKQKKSVKPIINIAV